MWGDDPEDYEYRKVEDVFTGVIGKRVQLPWGEDLLCGCHVNVVWLFTLESMYAKACVVRNIEPCEQHQKTDNYSLVDDRRIAIEAAEELAKELFHRYQENVIKKGVK
mgnify:CR=1 FL=1